MWSLPLFSNSISPFQRLFRDLVVNKAIQAGTVRLVVKNDAGGPASSSILSRDEALAKAQAAGLDLVLGKGRRGVEKRKIAHISNHGWRIVQTSCGKHAEDLSFFSSFPFFFQSSSNSRLRPLGVQTCRRKARKVSTSEKREENEKRWQRPEGNQHSGKTR